MKKSDFLIAVLASSLLLAIPLPLRARHRHVDCFNSSKKRGSAPSKKMGQSTVLVILPKKYLEHARAATMFPMQSLGVVF